MPRYASGAGRNARTSSTPFQGPPFARRKSPSPISCAIPIASTLDSGPRCAMNRLRLARFDDVADLQGLIARSARGLSVGYYTPAQTDAAVRYVFGVDSQLIADRTYFVVENDGQVVACGGWSRRRPLFGGDQAKSGPDPLLDPATEPARIRAFFVDPPMARRGLGRQLMAES